VLGCVPGRVRDGWVDVWFYGMQVTLHERPEQVLPAERDGVRHFGVTLSEDALDALVQRVGTHRVQWLHELATEHAGTPRQQTKAKLLDPSGNVIELKAYAEPSAAIATD
jgi:extradiol dioxygenase family protein